MRGMRSGLRSSALVTLSRGSSNSSTATFLLRPSFVYTSRTTGLGTYRHTLGAFGSARHFSASAMVAAIIDGTAIAKGIRQKLNAEIGEKQKVNPRYKPSLVILQGTLGPLLLPMVAIEADSTTQLAIDPTLGPTFA